MLKKFLKIFILSLIFVLPTSVFAETQSKQLVLGAGLGAFAGSNGLGGSFDFDIEPEYFVNDNLSVSFRFDVTAGKLDSAQLGARGKYYFGIANHEKWNIYAGAGGGFIINFDGPNYGSFSVPVLGLQYDLSKHLKVGSDASFDIVFNGSKTAFAGKIMPLQMKWAF